MHGAADKWFSLLIVYKSSYTFRKRPMGKGPKPTLETVKVTEIAWSIKALCAKGPVKTCLLLLQDKTLGRGHGCGQSLGGKGL